MKLCPRPLVCITDPPYSLARIATMAHSQVLWATDVKGQLDNDVTISHIPRTHPRAKHFATVKFAITEAESSGVLVYNAIFGPQVGSSVFLLAFVLRLLQDQTRGEEKTMPTPKMATATTPLPSLLRRLPNSWAPSMPFPVGRFLILPLFHLLFAVAILPAFAADEKPSYAAHCGSFVPESATDGAAIDPDTMLQLRNGYFTGGDRLLGREDNTTLSIPRSVFFRPRTLLGTLTPGVLAVKGTLRFRGGSAFVVRRNFSRGERGLFRVARPWGPAVLRERGRVGFDMSGFWSQATGNLCMVGSGITRSMEGNSLFLSAVLKLRYPKSSNITSSLVTGTLESLDSPLSPVHFDPISLLAYSQNIYNYTLIAQVKKVSADTVVTKTSLKLGAVKKLCSVLNSVGYGLRLVYGPDCDGRNCRIFSEASEAQTRFLSLGGLQCSEDGRFHLYILFSEVDRFGYNNQVRPNNMLVGEGFWDLERNHLSAVVCHVLDFKDSQGNAPVGNCTIGFKLWFPNALTIEKRSPVAGRIWSQQSPRSPGYFKPIEIQALHVNLHPVSGLRYEYTKIGIARKFCERNVVPNTHEKIYPDGKSVSDLRFDMYLGRTGREMFWAYAFPLSVGNTLYNNDFNDDIGGFQSGTAIETNHRILNISYKISSGYLNGSSYLSEFKDISAEGVYMQEMGTLCLIGCRDIVVEKQGTKKKSDCEILINVQIYPLNPGANDHLNGTLRSLRESSDPLYFEPLVISSNAIYAEQAMESIWRMDIEITMVLISLTLSCVFIGLQLVYVKNNSDVLSSTSITMLVVLTLGHMIPLVLNFEAIFFSNHNKQNVLLWSGGWLEVNEVIVRLVTMVAFLLQFRLLQLAWSARSVEATKKGLWIAERKALQFCLPLYFIGLLISWIVHSKSYVAQMPGPDSSDALAEEVHGSFWEDLISYAGLILDAFLLPQILLNAFHNTKEKVLLPVFYAGTTIVRALPHVYDAYRAHHYTPYIKNSYIYASPQGDFYSSVWDLIIPCGEFAFVVIIYVQQRFGGNRILPPRYRNAGGYEMVPVASG